MNDFFSILQSDPPSRIKTRSMGLKLIVVCGLALFMTIPAFFVSGLVDDRTQRAADVVQEISTHVGGQQTFLGPTLAIPYVIPPQSPAETAKRGIYLVFPAQASAQVKTATEERRRSLFKVPVFQADLKLDAAFDLAGVPAALPQGAQLDWSRAELVVGVSDARGALADATLTADGKTSTLVPAAISQDISIGGDQSQHLKLTLFGASAADLAKPDAKFNVTSALSSPAHNGSPCWPMARPPTSPSRGIGRARDSMAASCPATDTISGSGFTARVVRALHCPRRARRRARKTPSPASTQPLLGVSFVEVADPYQSVNRSLKYVLLFVGLIFLSYFVFEVSRPASAFIRRSTSWWASRRSSSICSCSRCAERIGFDWGFLLAGAATVMLLSTNAGWIFASRVQGCEGVRHLYSALRADLYAAAAGRQRAAGRRNCQLPCGGSLRCTSRAPSTGTVRSQHRVAANRRHHLQCRRAPHRAPQTRSPASQPRDDVGLRRCRSLLRRQPDKL